MAGQYLASVHIGCGGIHGLELFRQLDVDPTVGTTVSQVNSQTEGLQTEEPKKLKHTVYVLQNPLLDRVVHA